MIRSKTANSLRSSVTSSFFILIFGPTEAPTDANYGLDRCRNRHLTHQFNSLNHTITLGFYFPSACVQIYFHCGFPSLQLHQILLLEKFGSKIFYGNLWTFLPPTFAYFRITCNMYVNHKLSDVPQYLDCDTLNFTNSAWSLGPYWKEPSPSFFDK